MMKFCMAPGIHELHVKGSEIQGQGCYAGKPIPAGAFIVEYQGEMIPADIAYAREADPTRPGIYTFWIDDERAIDACHTGNIARFINHCCTPNCEYRVEGHRITIHAARDIACGEELTIDYAYSPEGEPVECRCSSAACRGVINAQDPG
jgi:histone-lysine N-methyltransferase SETD1